MKRDLGALADRSFDLVVVGGGIYGACIARDAAKRGLSTALVERGDFGGATSHNSFKLIHGGLRYLQQLDIQRLRQSALEQRRWLKIAPHLVAPLAFVMPTMGRGSRSPLALAAALRVYDWLARRGEPRTPAVPPGRVIDSTAARELLGHAPPGMNGGAIWYDVQMANADRLLLECVIDAVAAGAVVANYVAAEGFLGDDGKVTGIRAQDRLTGTPFAVPARLTVNAAGPEAARLLEHLPSRPAQRFGRLSRAMNLVVRRRLTGDHAIALSSRRPSDALVPRADGRLFFVQPWQGLSVIGTSHLVHEGDPESFTFDEPWLEEFLAEVNDAYPPARLTRRDVIYCYAGLTPAAGEPRGSEVQRSRRGVMVDHERTDGVRGLVSVQGVKYTTARLVAEHLVDLAAAKLGTAVAPCRTWQDPLPGAADAAPTAQPLADFATRVRHALRHEMAMRLDDLLVRRLDAVATGRLTRPHLDLAADLMAQASDWSGAERAKAVAEFEALVARHCPTGLAGAVASVAQEPALDLAQDAGL